MFIHPELFCQIRRDLLIPREEETSTVTHVDDSASVDDTSTALPAGVHVSTESSQNSQNLSRSETIELTSPSVTENLCTECLKCTALKKDKRRLQNKVSKLKGKFCELTKGKSVTRDVSRYFLSFSATSNFKC